MIIHGDSSIELDKLPISSVQCLITSPPYYNQRNYNSESEIGHEKTPELFVNRLVSVLRQCKSCMKPDGTVWVNIGDTYRDFSALGIPWRFAIAFSRHGFYLRQEIIWNKTRCRPENVTNRCTISHEPIFMFSLTKDYQFNPEAIREKNSPTSKTGGRFNLNYKYGESQFKKGSVTPRNGRNKRSVWNIAASKGTSKHPAPFPKELVETILLASTNEGDTVLDPFAGSGTVGIVARKMKRDFILIDSNKQFCEELKQLL